MVLVAYESLSGLWGLGVGWFFFHSCLSYHTNPDLKNGLYFKAINLKACEGVSWTSKKAIRVVSVGLEKNATMVRASKPLPQDFFPFNLKGVLSC